MRIGTVFGRNFLVNIAVESLEARLYLVVDITVTKIRVSNVVVEKSFQAFVVLIIGLLT